MSFHLSSGAPSPISLAEYIRRIDRLRQILDRITKVRGYGLDAAAHQMESLGRVRIGDGRAVTTPLPDWGCQIISGRTANARSIRGQLDALDRALHVVRRHHWRPAQLRQLDTVLRDPRFHPHLNPVQAAEAWLGDRVAQLLRILGHDLASDVPSGHPIVTALVAVIFLLLVAGIGTVIARAAIRRGAASVPARETPAQVASPNAARQRAGEMAAAESYREAFRYLFLATLLELRDAGLLQLRPGDTNREYVFSLDDIPGTTQQREALVSLVDEFDRVWYGHQPFTRAQYDRCAALAAQIIEPAVGGRIA